MFRRAAKAVRQRLSRLFRSLPPVQRLRNRIDELETQLSETAEHYDGPSFRLSLRNASRESHAFRELGFDWSELSGFANDKFGMRSLAESLGLNTPTILGQWDDLDSIPWDTLPKSFVLKTMHGSSGHGVLPMTRHGNEWSVINSPRHGTLEDILAPLKGKLGRLGTAGPFHIEAFLGDDDGGNLPHDIKVYAFYGQIGIVWVRKVINYHGGMKGKRSTFFDAFGERVLNAIPVTPPDHTIELPRLFDDALNMAREISLHTRLPHVRVDMYEHDGRIFLGEITPWCGHRRHYSFGDEWDAYLGHLWENAQARVTADLMEGNLNPKGPVVRTGSLPIPELLAKPPTIS